MNYRSQARRLRLREFIWVGAGLIGLIIFWYAAELRHARQVTPNGWSTVAGFIERHGEPLVVYEVSNGGTNLFEFAGNLHAPLSFAMPSSPPVYVFDADGQLVDWCADPGDDLRHRRKWPRSGPNALSAQKVQELLQRQNR